MQLARFSRIGFILAAAGSAVGLGNIWKYAGFMIFTGVLILSFYTVVIGWIIKYVVISVTSLPSSVKEAGDAFGGMVTTDATSQFIYFNIAFFITIFIVARGIKKGIEKVNLILMPLLILILLALFFYAITLDGFSQALSFLFLPDWSKVTDTTILQAVGHAFFTLSLGMGTIMAYAASLPKESNVLRASISVAFIDTAIAIIAGLVIFSFLFNAGAEPSAGPGLVFISLPPVFFEFGSLGNLFSLAFFVALGFAGITSAVSIIEPTILYLTNRFSYSRVKSLFIIGIATYVLGVMALLSNVKEYASYVTFGGKGAFDIFDFASSSILLPLGGIVVAIFVGHILSREKVYGMLREYMSDTIFSLWYFSVKYVIPIAVSVVMINKIFF